MRATRLAHAIETGALVLPEAGRIAVFRPAPDDDLSALPAARVSVVTSDRVAQAAFAAQGLAVARRAEPGQALAILCLPRARAHARALFAEAVAAVGPGGPVVVDGQKTDGIEAMQRDLAQLGLGAAWVVTKSHGRCFGLVAPDAPPAGWAAAWHEVAGGFLTLPGVFSADGPDPASVLLAGSLPARLPARMADLGAGWGWLSAQALRHEGIATLDLIEADADALDCARRNITDARARFVWEDARRHRPATPYDGILCNPPFHAGRSADPALGQAFIAAAARMLGPSGSLWLVANRHLPYEEALAAAFAEVAEIASTASFRVWQASRPRALSPGRQPGRQLGRQPGRPPKGSAKRPARTPPGRQR